MAPLDHIVGLVLGISVGVSIVLVELKLLNPQRLPFMLLTMVGAAYVGIHEFPDGISGDLISNGIVSIMSALCIIIRITKGFCS